MKGKIKIVIIGFGRFGKFMAKHLKKKADILATDEIDLRNKAKEIGVKFSSLNDVLSRRIIILAVPMENLKEVLSKIKGRILPHSLVLDICSLKMFSTKLMKEILPKDIELIGTHPLFGPQSARKSIKGMKIALCNIRARKTTLERVRLFCKSLDLKVFIETPEEHDRQMAVSQALTHFIGQVAKKMKIKRVELGTKTFDDLMNIIDIIKNDTKPLFENMQTMNPFAGKIRNKFIVESVKLNKKLR